MSYPTTATLVASSVVPELLAATEAQQDALRETAILAVERFTGQVFEATEDDATLTEDGSGGNELLLGRRAETLTGVTVKGADYDLSSVTLSEDGSRIYFSALDQGYAVAAMREERAWDSRTFRAGPGTVILTGTFGWSECPAGVVQALRIEMEEQARADASELTNIVGIARRLGLKDISQGNLRANIGDPSLISARAAQLVSGLIWRGRGGYML